MSRSHGRTTAQNFPEFAQNLDYCIYELIFFAFQPLFVVFFFLIPTYYVILGVIFALFHLQNFKTKDLTAQKNLLLECLASP